MSWPGTRAAHAAFTAAAGAALAGVRSANESHAFATCSWYSPSRPRQRGSTVYSGTDATSAYTRAAPVVAAVPVWV